MNDVPCIDCLKLPICINKNINLLTNHCKELYDYIYEESEVQDRRDFDSTHETQIYFDIIVTRVNITHSRYVREYYESFKRSE